jgi:hypothetical protein
MVIQYHSAVLWSNAATLAWIKEKKFLGMCTCTVNSTTAKSGQAAVMVEWKMWSSGDFQFACSKQPSYYLSEEESQQTVTHTVKLLIKVSVGSMGFDH